MTNQCADDTCKYKCLRAAADANEVGESFKPLVPRWMYAASYGVVGAYVCADAAWRATVPPPGRSPAVEALDTVVWQGLASVMLPGFVINRIVWAVGRVSPPTALIWAPTAVGLVSIPLIISPIDRGVESFMQILRPLYPREGSRKSD